MEPHPPPRPPPPPPRDSPPPLSAVIPDELVIDILSRLPVKSLARFRCVSKSWDSLISRDPQFLKLHRHRSPKNTNLILTVTKRQEGETRVLWCSKQTLIENPNSIDVAAGDGSFPIKQGCWCVGSCNGLVCFRKNYFEKKNLDAWVVRFWNPALRFRSNNSPPLSAHRRPTKFGFGYVSSTDTYKVLVLILYKEETVGTIHSMGDPDWRDVFIIPAFQFLGQPHGQFVNGSLYWLALHDFGCCRYGATITDMKESAIFSFDLEMETQKTLSLPDALDDEVPEYDPELFVLSDCLCLAIFLRGTHGIWQMKEVGDGESWSQLFTINYEYLQIQMDTRFTIRLLCTSETDDIIVLVDNAHHRAILYNWKDNRVIGGIEIPVNQVWGNAMDYIPCLIHHPYLVLPC